jgi:hypothetical protein
LTGQGIDDIDKSLLTVFYSIKPVSLGGDTGLIFIEIPFNHCKAIKISG